PGPWRADLDRLADTGLTDRQIAVELSRRHAPLQFTRRMVIYYRHEDRRLDNADDAGNARQQAALCYQMHRRLGHLLPAIQLRPRETDILALLLDRGPLRLVEIRSALSLRSLYTGAESWLARLARMGLIEREGRG